MTQELDDTPISNLATLAQAAVRSLTVAELHGATIGLAVHGPDVLEVEELVELLGTDALEDAGSVSDFCQAATEALYADDMSFAPLLLAVEPSEFDAGAAEQQAVALADWCSAFLAGLAAGFALHSDDTPILGGPAGGGGIDGFVNQLSDDSQEIVQDMMAIAQLDTSVATGEDADKALIELEEYLKVSTLLIMSSLAAAGAQRAEVDG